MSHYDIPEDNEHATVFVQHKEGIVSIGQEGNGKIYEDVINITLHQAEQLRDYLNDLFDVEK